MFLLILKAAMTLIVEIILLMFSAASFMATNDFFEMARSPDRSVWGRARLVRNGITAFLIGALGVFAASALVFYFWIV